MSSIHQRLSDLVEELKLSKNQFANEIGTSSAMISKITKSKVNFGVDILEKIISRYPRLNQQWLLTGIGNIWDETHTQNPHLNPHLNDKSTKKIITKGSKDDIVDKSYVDTYGTPFYLERYAHKKIIRELMKGEGDEASLYQNINNLMTLYYIIMNLDHHYFEKIDRKIHAVVNFADSESFDYEGYKTSVIEEIRNNLGFNEALTKFSKAIDEFYNDAKVADKEGIIEGYINFKF